MGNDFIKLFISDNTFCFVKAGTVACPVVGFGLGCLLGLAAQEA